MAGIRSIFSDNLTRVVSRKRIPISESNIRAALDDAYTSLDNSASEYVNLFGAKVKIKDPLGEKTSLEVIPTYNCNADCHFCIANMHTRPDRNLTDNDLITLTNRVIEEYRNNQLNFEMRVTGGEPLVFYERLKKLLATISKNKISHYRVNTNGSLLSSGRNVEMLRYYAENEPFILDVSRHHFDDGLNNRAFNRKVIGAEELAELNHKLKQKVMLRAILMKGYLDSLAKVKEFIEHFQKLGFDIFSFKNLTDFKPENYSELSEHQFVQSNKVNFLDIINSAERDEEFQFKNQIIESDSLRELYNYKGATVKFSYLDTEQAKNLNEKERQNGEIVLRRGVIFPEGRFSTNWDKEVSTIYKYPVA